MREIRFKGMLGSGRGSVARKSYGRSSAALLVVTLSTCLIATTPSVASAATAKSDTDGASNHSIAADSLVSIPANAAGSVEMHSNDHSGVTIGLPGGSTLAQDTETVVDGGGVAFSDNNEALPNLNATPTPDGVAVVAVLEGLSAKTTLRFPIGVEGDSRSRLDLQSDGSVVLVERQSFGDEYADTLVGTFAAPWARDATGAPIPTHYVIDGMTLVQIVEPTADAKYPIEADPNFGFGWAGPYVQWSRSGAKYLNGLSLAALGGAVSVLCGGPVCAAGVAGLWYFLNSVSGTAIDAIYNRGCRLRSYLVTYGGTVVVC